jgi:membrane-bound serine protease (ClpP class)
MKGLLAPILWQLAGIVVVVVEIFLPTAGVLAITALAIFGYSLYLAFTGVSTLAGTILALVDLVMIPALVVIGIKALARSPLTLRTELASKRGVTSQAPGLERYLGQEGEAQSDLRPAGLARIAGQRLDVVTRGEYIDQGSRVVVLAVQANQIVVGKKN